jgi:hypothetical protein
MLIYIYKNGHQSGPFSENVIIEQLKSGQLSPNDKGIREGEKDWRSLGVLFPDVKKADVRQTQIPAAEAEPIQFAAASYAAAEPAKTGGGCRRIFGWLLLILGLLIFLGAAGTAIVIRSWDQTSCQTADMLKKEADEALKEYEFAKGTSREVEAEKKANEKIKSFDFWSDGCGRLLESRRRQFVTVLVVGFVGLMLAVVGFFVRRI